MFKGKTKEDVMKSSVEMVSESLKLLKIRGQIIAKCNTNDDAGVYNLLKDIRPAGYTILNLQERKCLISLFAGSSVGENREKMILNLLKYIPTNQIEEIFNELKNDKSKLLKRLISIMDNEVFGVYGSNNYTELFLTINTLYSRYNKQVGSVNIYWGVGQDVRVTQGAVNHTTFGDNDEKIALTGLYSFKLNNPKDLTPVEQISVAESLDPFAPVNLTFYSIPTVGNVGNIAVGKVYLVPAVFIYFLDKHIWSTLIG